jgi:hypothetical protein
VRLMNEENPNGPTIGSPGPYAPKPALDDFQETSLLKQYSQADSLSSD